MRWASELAATEAVASAATGISWELGIDGESESRAIRIILSDGTDALMRVTRDRQSATPGDIEFIAASRKDLLILGDAIRGRRAIATDELDGIEKRIEQTSPGPWQAFLEADAGIGGTNVIRLIQSR